MSAPVTGSGGVVTLRLNAGPTANIEGPTLHFGQASMLASTTLCGPDDAAHLVGRVSEYQK
jgi:hypothetical protein